MNKRFILFTVFLVILFYSTISIASPNQSFTTSKLDDFVHEIIAKKDKAAFQVYYQKFLDKQKKLHIVAKHKQLAKIREKALCNLEVIHPNWARQINMCISTKSDSHEEDTKLVRTFLTRYGIYQEFLKEKALSHATVWHKVRLYAHNVRSKVTHWFGLFKRTRTS